MRIFLGFLFLFLQYYSEIRYGLFCNKTLDLVSRSKTENPKLFGVTEATLVMFSQIPNEACFVIELGESDKVTKWTESGVTISIFMVIAFQPLPSSPHFENFDLSIRMNIQLTLSW